MTPGASDEAARGEREAARLRALDEYQVLDTAPEAVFDDIVHIAAEICGVPMALISLVDDKRQWFKAAIGLSAKETPREIAFCAHAIQQDGVFLVEDATRDSRFAGNPLVTGDPNLRFYAGAPLLTPAGLAIGTLCVLDSRPGQLSRTQHLALEALGRQVVTQMELRKALVTKRADDERNRITEDLLRRAQEAGGVGVFSIDLHTNRVSGTPQFWKVFGLEDCDSIPAEAINALVVAEDAALMSNVATRTAETAKLDTEYRIRRRDTGQLRWIARKAEYERDATGKALRLMGTVRDVTVRRQAQRAAEESATQFRTFAQTLPNHAWTATPDGRLDWFNERTYTYSGVAAGEFGGNGWSTLVHEEDLAASADRWAASLSSGQPYEGEFRLRRADGEYRWHLTRALPVFTAEGSIGRWVGTNTDIHERKLAETQSTQDRDRIWNSTNDLMGTLGSDGFLKSVNPAWKRLLGYDESEILGRPFAHIIAPGDRSRLASVIAHLSASKPVANLEDHLIHKDGAQSLMAWSAEPEGDLYYIVGRNVTEQRAAEDALRQAMKMEAVGQLTGGIAHDFNNLLQGITGSLDLLRRRVAQGRIDELDRFIRGAMASANRASALTHRLLAFSRRQPLDPRPVQANPLLGSMEDLLRRTLGESIRLDIVMAGGLWATQCDPNQLENAVLNLIINARDAMPDGGTLTVETSNAQLDHAQASRDPDVKPGHYVCIAVTDTGTGMSADTISKAFEPFFTTKPLGQGTGLGLSMIYGFVRQSEGYTKIDSELGRGTTVKLYLPRHRGATEIDKGVADVPEARATTGNEVVLVVEDETVVRTLIVDVLKDLGYQAIEAYDGPSGLLQLQSKRHIDLLISDIGLPGLNGRQIADAARQARPNLKILFMTGYAENAAIASGFLESGMSMITKPFAMDAFATRIRSILEGA